MKNLKSLIAAAAVVAMSGAAHAATTALDGPAGPAGPNGARIFAFEGEDIDGTDAQHESTNFSSSAPAITIGQTTSVDVQPYLFVQGSLGGNWTANGWDSTESDVQTSAVEVYHNSNFTGHWSGFGNPKRTNPDTGAVEELPMTVQEGYETAAGGVSPGHVSFGSALPADHLNTFSNDYNPQYVTKGYVKWVLQQTIHVPTNVPSGTYTVSPTITLTSNAPAS